MPRQPRDSGLGPSNHFQQEGRTHFLFISCNNEVRKYDFVLRTSSIYYLIRCATQYHFLLRSMALYYSVLHKPRRQHLLTRTFINLKIASEGPPPSSPQIASIEYKAQEEIVSAPPAPRFTCVLHTLAL